MRIFKSEPYLVIEDRGKQILLNRDDRTSLIREVLEIEASENPPEVVYFEKLGYARGACSMVPHLVDIRDWIRDADESYGLGLDDGEWASAIDGRMKLVEILKKAGLEV